MVLMVLLPACLVLGMYWLRGGSCILDSAGVRLIYGGVEVSCPWSLFVALGQPVIHPPYSRNRFELPVAAAAAPRVEACRNDLVIAQGLAVKTRQLRFRSAHEVILRNLYRVKADELSWLLLHLGRSQALSSFTLKELPAQTYSQGNFQTQQPAENLAAKDLVSSPPTTRKTDGWITVSLTRQAFPPWCCNCGASTTCTKAVRAFTPLLRLGPFLNIEGAQHVWLPIPMCQACQGDTSRQYRKAFERTFLMVLAIGAGGGFLLGELITLLGGNPKLFPLLPVFLSLSAGLVSLFFAWLLGKRAAGKVAAPVQLQRYLPEKGTVDVRFRRCEYAEQILHAAQSRLPEVR
jgi:hypothetical protein